MQTVGHVESLWRYPVKSMRGEEVQSAFIGFAGIYGDRLYAIRSAAASKNFPYLTAREQQQMLLYRPEFRDLESMKRPVNLTEAEALEPGVTPLYAEAAATLVDVQTPAGSKFAIDDPRLLQSLREGIEDRHQLTLLRSDRALTDCQPISLFSVQTVRQLGNELGITLDKRSFRANIYVDLQAAGAYSENSFVGRTLQIGRRVRVSVTGRDPRCKMITLDPDTAQAQPEIMRHLARSHDGKAGIYAAVLIEGTIHPGDPLELAS